jgi:hypothetical protein
MLWLAAKVKIDHKQIVLAACDCAETALRHVPEGEDRPRKAIKTARAWARGEATLDEVRTAAYADADADADAAAAAAAYAAAAAAYAADAAAAAAAYAAYAAHAAYARRKARAKALKKCAAITRRHIGWREIETAIQQTNKPQADTDGGSDA